MSNVREKHIAEMNRLREAIGRTESECLKRDYTKALRRMEKDLRDYDRFRNQGKSGSGTE